METIGIFEAKTHLSEIVARVQAGEKYIITNRHKEVAMIVPVESIEPHDKYHALERLMDLQMHHPLGSPTDILEMRDEGRR